MAVSKKTRFEVFKRDGFKCQYCGRSAPDVTLEADHIEPRSKGGKDSVINLVTACRDCNAGKSDRRLDDQTALAKERRQLEELNERREQIEMMLKWKTGLLGIDQDAAEAAAKHFGSLFSCTVNDTGVTTLRKLVRKFGLDEVLEAVNIASDQYSEAEKAFTKLGGILHVRKRESTDPDFGIVCRVKSKLKWRQFYVNDREAERLVRSLLATGKYSGETLIGFVSNVRNWSEWKVGMQEAIRQHDAQGVS